MGTARASGGLKEGRPEALRRDRRLDPKYEIPLDLGMFCAEANQRLRAALEHHLKNLVTVAEIFDLDTEAKRLRTLLNPAVKSAPDGHTYDYFLGAP
jgi:hypothetical protein